MQPTERDWQTPQGAAPTRDQAVLPIHGELLGGHHCCRTAELELVELCLAASPAFQLSYVCLSLAVLRWDLRWGAMTISSHIMGLQGSYSATSALQKKPTSEELPSLPVIAATVSPANMLARLVSVGTGMCGRRVGGPSVVRRPTLQTFPGIRSRF